MSTVDAFRRAFDQAEQQPEDMRRRIAGLIGLALEEAEWDAMVSTPDSQEFLAWLPAEGARGELRRRDART